MVTHRINTEKIKTLEDVIYLFKLLDIRLNKKHEMFSELNEKGYLKEIKENNLVQMKKQ